MKLPWELAGIFVVCALVFGAAALMQAAEQPSPQAVPLRIRGVETAGGTVEVMVWDTAPPTSTQLDRIEAMLCALRPVKCIEDDPSTVGVRCRRVPAMTIAPVSP
jgi:hypothetical protein